MQENDQDTTFDQVAGWSEEQLEAWVRNNMTSLPKSNWHQKQVAIWARKVLNFSPQSAQILIQQAIDGDALPLVASCEKLESFGIPYGNACKLWKKILLLKQSLEDPVSEVASAVKSMSLGDATPVKNLVRSSVRKKKRQTILDVLEHANDQTKALFLADWFEEVVSKKEVAKQLKYDDDAEVSGLELETEEYLKTIPLQDRAPAMRKLESFCNLRFAKYAYKSKQDHAYLTIFGPSGAGKTRLCFEALKVIENKAVAMGIPFLALYLDFSNGARFDDNIDSKLKGSSFLAARVATELLAEHSYDKFIMAARHTYSDDTIADIFNHLSLEAVIAAYCHKNNQKRKMAVALVLDEINELYATELSNPELKGITKNVAIEIGSFMRPSVTYMNNKQKFPSQQTILLPVICGTSMDGIDAAIKVSGFSCYSPEITLLRNSSVEKCFSEYCNRKKTELKTKITDYQLTQILQYFGVIPRGLEFIIDSLQKHDVADKFSTLVSAIHSQLDGWFNFLKFEGAFGEPAQAKLFTQMCIIGLSCTSQFSRSAQNIIEQAKRAGLYYTLNNRLFFCPSILKILNEHLHLFTDELLPLPSTPFYWQHFERLEVQLEVIKVNTWLGMGHTQIPIATLFAGATCGSGVKNISILLTKMKYYEDSEQFPRKEKYTEEMNRVTNNNTIFDLVIQCRDSNPLLDIHSAYKTNRGKPVLIVKQLKHGKLLEKSTTEKKKTINYLLISDWLQKTKQLLTTQGYTNAFRIFYVWITNKEVLSAPKFLPNDLVLVDSRNVKEYFGPSISMLSNLAKIEDEPNKDE